jgi:hypothetical protein
MFAVNPPIANTPSKGVIGEREVLAERQPMLEAGALRDVQATGRRLRQDGVDSVVFIGWVSHFGNPTKRWKGSALFPSAGQPLLHSRANWRSAARFAFVVDRSL